MCCVTKALPICFIDCKYHKATEKQKKFNQSYAIHITPYHATGY